MARTSNKSVNTADISVTEKSVDTVSREEFDALVKKNDELLEMLKKLSETKPVTVSSNTSKDDDYWTLVHLQDCDPRLPTTFVVNGKIHYFTTFGETKRFPSNELGDIIAQCRNYFTRGVFALGNDCEKYQYEIPSDIIRLTLPESFFKTMTELDDDSFERNIDKLTEAQILQIANVWKNKYFQKNRAYRSSNKVKMLNKRTNGFMKIVLDDMNES